MADPGDEATPIEHVLEVLTEHGLGAMAEAMQTLMNAAMKLERTRVACGIDLGEIAAQAGVWEGITTYPEAEHARSAGRLMPT